MPWKFNPFSGTLDQTGSGGGGAQYLDGEVATYNDLPLDGTAAADSAWLVRSASGSWLTGRRPAGIYIRTATAGVSRDADYTYAGIFPDVFSDANFTLYDDGDATKTAQFQLSGITTGTNRVVSLPDKNITLDDAGDARTPTAHTHELANLDATGATDGHVLTADGAGGAAWEAASGGDTVSIDTTAADVLTATSGAISADDGGTIDSADPFIKWDDTAGKLVYANPLSRPSGAFYVGLAPTTTALGSGSVNIQPSRTNANQVASATDAINIGKNARCTGSEGIRIGVGGLADYTHAICIGASTIVGNFDSVAIGTDAVGNGENGVAIGNSVKSSLRGQFATRPFFSLYWGGQTTNDTATVIGLDLSTGAPAANRFTIAANTALAVDILLVARRSDVADKWLVARRFLGIRRDGSNNTSLIGSVQTLGTDQSDGSPTWSFALTADDTNEALQLEVTGAASETVEWRATAFYRVV